MKKDILIFIIFFIPNIFFVNTCYSEEFELKGHETFLSKIGSLKTSKANLRTGPGKKYPIKWIFIKKKWPIRIIAKHDHWRKIKTIDNIEGWFHQSQLSSKKTSVVMTSDYLRKKPRQSSTKIAFLKENLIVNIIKCKIFWCKIEIKGRRFKGWFIKEQLWGTNFITIEK